MKTSTKLMLGGAGIISHAFLPDFLSEVIPLNFTLSWSSLLVGGKAVIVGMGLSPNAFRSTIT